MPSDFTDSASALTQSSHPYVLIQNQNDRQLRFLAAYRVRGTISKAAEDSGCGRDTVYGWLQTDANGFKDQLESARVDFVESLENLMLERLKDPTGNRGSDVLLMFGLNAGNPSKYRPNAPPVDNEGKDIIKALRASGVRKLKARETVREVEIEVEGEG